MHNFCNQQLKEFTDVESLEEIGNNTSWWEDFNKENPNYNLSTTSTLKPHLYYLFENFFPSILNH